MFFKNASLLLFVKFLWLGLIFGVVSIVLKMLAKIFKKNVFVVNLLGFIYWICFGCVWIIFSMKSSMLSISLSGLCAMTLGVIIIKISIDFFFDYFIRFIYNEFRKSKRKLQNGKLQASEKNWKLYKT